MIEIRTVGDLAELLGRIAREDKAIDHARGAFTVGTLNWEAAELRWNSFCGEEVEFNPLGINHA